jgi:hypothetical protein
MKSSIKKLFIVSWIIGATLMIAFFWGNYPDIFPRPPEKISIWLTRFFKITNGEELSDFELFYMLLISFLFVLFVTFISRYIWSRTQNMLTNKFSGRKKPRR